MTTERVDNIRQMIEAGKWDYDPDCCCSDCADIREALSNLDSLVDEHGRLRDFLADAGGVIVSLRNAEPVFRTEGRGKWAFEENFIAELADRAEALAEAIP